MKTIRVIAIVTVICALWFLFAFRQDIGAHINDRYKQELLAQYFGPDKTSDLNVLESTTFCGIDEVTGDFIIWVGIIVESDLPYEQFRAVVDGIYGKSMSVECSAYNKDLVNIYGFTGIQKEVAGLDSTEGFYMVGCRFIPKTSVDKRNAHP